MAGYESFAALYDALTDNVDYDAMGAYLCDLLAAHGAGEGILLDLACGTGTLSAVFAAKGYDVIGVDASEEMLAEAQEKRIEAGFDALFLCQKMEELDLFGTIDAAVCTLDSLNHLTNPDAFCEALRRVALFMNDGGVFVFDVNTPYKHAAVLGNNTFVYDLDEVYCVWQNSFDEDTQTTRISLDLFTADAAEPDVYVRETEEFSERAYDLDFVCDALEKVRFEVLSVQDADTHGALTQTSERALFLCKKHGTQLL
ncbi:MAG: class I SAM-dependent methyltransferase [Clostridia bacterium]|nr:class I SAM-dependent methyltransferase [Clostridia bacterium]